MKAWIYPFAVAAGLSGAAIAQNANPQPAAETFPQERGAAATQGNRDPGAETVAVPPDNPGSTSVDPSVVEAPRTSNQASDRTTSREWQGLGSTGGATGTGTSSGTTADEVAPGQDGNLPSAGGAGNKQNAGKEMREERVKPARE